MNEGLLGDKDKINNGEDIFDSIALNKKLSNQAHHIITHQKEGKEQLNEEQE